jgi:hypothetical protein
MTSVCEACENAASDTSEPSGVEAAPYHVCYACHRRLLARALRPIEWYNLAKRHGSWPFLLHDDLYDEDGTGSQPECDIESPCLEHRDGFDRVVNGLSHRNEREKRGLMFSLSYFHSKEALDWIEANIFSPVTDAWGYLAAGSEFDWPRATNWLDHGRLLSLVALDALAAIIRPQTPLLHAYAPRLRQPPDFDTLKSVLEAYVERDNAPRVKMMTAFILKNAVVVTSGE